MGEVYRARDARLERVVALKVLPEELFGDKDRRRRFEQEARLLAALNHPNVAAVHSFEEIPGSEGSAARHVLSMELIEGKSLRETLAAGALPAKRLLDLSGQIAEGLAKAHAAGIVHRDLKPENVMVSKDGVVKILDFGLAKLLKEQPGEGTDIPTATRAGTVMGTVGYMSPEQASGKPVDFRSDQFSLGSILYEMASGKRAFERSTGAETLTAIIREEAEPLGRLAASVPGPFRWLVERCLQKDPEERYASTRDLARDLKSIREHLSDSAVSVAGEVSGRTIAARPGAREARIARRALRRGAAPRARRRRAPPEALQPDGAAVLPADHVRQRHDPVGALRARRSDDRLFRRLGRRSAQDLPEAPVQPGLAAARAPEREPPRHLALGRDGDRDGLPLEPSRALRGDARARRADGRRAPRRRGGDPGSRLGPGRGLHARRARRRRQVAHRVPDGQGPLRDLGARELRAPLAEGRPDRVPRPRVPPGRRRDGGGHRSFGQEDEADGPVGERARTRVGPLGPGGLVHGDGSGREPLPLRRGPVGAAARRDACSREG